MVYPGDILYMKNGPRHKAHRFAEREVTRVRDCSISDQTVMIWKEDNSGFIVPPLDKFARCEGFQDWCELREYFLAMHGQDGPDGLFFLVRGQLIQWAEADWDKPIKTKRNKARGKRA
jgi:hypothetical protein